MLEFKRELEGIDAIGEFMGARSITILLDWKSGYGLPILKINGRYCASKAELTEWKRQHPDLTATPAVIQRVKIKPPRPTRWG
jgi:hypothetical protein